MKFISPLVRISIGLAVVTVSLLLMSDLLGLMPNKNESTIKIRQVISESLAIQFSSATNRENFSFTRDTFDKVVNRNDEVISAALRLNDGTFLLQTNQHEKHWGKVTNNKSTPTHVQVPVYDAGETWGTIEVRFKDMWSGSYIESLKNNTVGLILFMLFSGFVMYFFFLKKILLELNPSSVVPERVKSAFDALAEGVLILDEEHRVVLVNSFFALKCGIDESSLIGKDSGYLIETLCSNESSEIKSNWQRALKGINTGEGLPVGIMNLKTSERHSLVVNSSLILDANKDPRGVLVTFDDFTELESKHSELLVALNKLERSQVHISKKNEELHLLATRDSLTDCLNRRAFFGKFDKLFKYAVENKSPLCCLMLDLDKFKLVNDTYGHAIGDQVIKEFANIIKDNTRNDDVVGRYGGEEFCIVLPELDFEKAKQAAERLREAVQNKELQTEKGVIKFTTSVGLSMLSSESDSPSALVSQADQALYSAKKNGRNKCISWEDSNKSGVFDTIFSASNKIFSPSKTSSNLSLDNTSTSLNNSSTSLIMKSANRLSLLDQVTGLPTPTLFYEKIIKAISCAKRDNNYAALLTFDVDRFSHINNELGRQAGNMVLKEIASRFSDVVRETDSEGKMDEDTVLNKGVCRLGADSFGILLSELKSTNAVNAVIERLHDVLSEKYKIQSNELVLTGAFGVSIYPHDGNTAEDLIDKAVIAKNHAKTKSGSKRFQFYSQSIHDSSSKQMFLEAELYNALHNKEFKLEYQPIVDINTGKINAVEALVRWHSPVRGLVPPNEFIPLAEATGLIEPLGKWILRTVCQQAKLWQAKGMLSFRVAVNISPVQFCSNSLLEFVEKVLDEVDLSPEYLELEITESSVMESIDIASASLQKLHDLGASISLDDFGTGYSSLGYIKHFPIDKLKIDKLFLQDIANDDRDSAIVGSITSVAHSIGLSVVAEGVEDYDQLIALRRLNCDNIQGYLVSRPISAEKLTELISSDHDYFENIKASGDLEDTFLKEAI